mmetsp:Transcript_159360/g.511272  ORF Transcript_159360/g.511272 Transcript_159360/m.511272 type:complete len:301 (-) Transcript_159360:70-972(-)
MVHNALVDKTCPEPTVFRFKLPHAKAEVEAHGNNRSHEPTFWASASQHKALLQVVQISPQIHVLARFRRRSARKQVALQLGQNSGRDSHCRPKDPAWLYHDASFMPPVAARIDNRLSCIAQCRDGCKSGVGLHMVKKQLFLHFLIHLSSPSRLFYLRTSQCTSEQQERRPTALKGVEPRKPYHLCSKILHITMFQKLHGNHSQWAFLFEFCGWLAGATAIGPQVQGCASLLEASLRQQRGEHVVALMYPEWAIIVLIILCPDRRKVTAPTTAGRALGEWLTNHISRECATSRPRSRCILA